MPKSSAGSKRRSDAYEHPPVSQRVKSLEMIAVRCARVPANLPASIVAGWVDALPRQRQADLARRLAKGNGMNSLTGLALLASFSSDCRLPPLDRLCWSSNGKPCFADGPDFSITHSCRLCGSVPSRRRACGIGIDLGTGRSCAHGGDPPRRERCRNAARWNVAAVEPRRALDVQGSSPQGFRCGPFGHRQGPRPWRPRSFRWCRFPRAALALD